MKKRILKILMIIILIFMALVIAVCLVMNSAEKHFGAANKETAKTATLSDAPTDLKAVKKTYKDTFGVKDALDYINNDKTLGLKTTVLTDKIHTTEGYKDKILTEIGNGMTDLDGFVNVLLYSEDGKNLDSVDISLLYYGENDQPFTPNEELLCKEMFKHFIPDITDDEAGKIADDLFNKVKVRIKAGDKCFEVYETINGKEISMASNAGMIDIRDALD